MTRPTIAEREWLQYTIQDHLEPALEAAKQQLSDLENLEMCDIAGCGMMFDRRDPRCSIAEYTKFENGKSAGRMACCPACEIEHDAAKARDALKKAVSWERKCDKCL